MTRLVSLWHVPDEENEKKITNTVNDGKFSCHRAIAPALQYVKKFNCAIDVGTWIGDSTDVISRLFSKVYGFEASPTVFECTLKNLKNRNNIILDNIALSDTEGVKELFNRRSSVSGWINTLEDVKGIYYTKKMLVKCKTIDSYDFLNIDFIKIDIDSHEGYFLKGATKFFQNNNPVVLIEHKPEVLLRQNSNMPNALELLQSIGYNIVLQPTNIDYVLIRNL
jgi:FkbM family methyltransferase